MHLLLFMKQFVFPRAEIELGQIHHTADPLRLLEKTVQPLQSQSDEDSRRTLYATGIHVQGTTQTKQHIDLFSLSFFHKHYFDRDELPVV